MKVIKRFLCYCYEMGFIKLDYRSLFPSNKLRSYTEIPSVYTPDEVFQVLEYIKSQDSPNKKRNYAIAVLIAIYGFRAGDIMKLKLSDIDWENEMIYIIKSKTLQQLTSQSRNIPAHQTWSTVCHVFLRRFTTPACVFLKYLT